MIKKLNLSLRRTSETGLFHDSRKDARLLMDFCNKMSDKIDELIEANNKLESEIQNLKAK